MIILPHNRFFGTDIQTRKQLEKGFAEIGWFGKSRFGIFRGFPFGCQFHLRHTVMQKFHIQIRHCFFAVANMKYSRLCERAQHRSIHSHLFGKLGKQAYFSGINGQRHALLRFRYQNFPGLKAGVF